MLATFPNLLEVDWGALDWVAVTARLHPLVLHLPIALLTLLFMVELYSAMRGRRGERDTTRGFLVFLLALSTPLAAASGWFLAEEGYGEGVDWHRWFGVGTGIATLLTCLAYAVRGRAYAGLLLLSFGGVLATGHLGAEITHGDDFLFEPWHDAIPTPESRVDGLQPQVEQATEPGDDEQGQEEPADGAPGPAEPGAGAGAVSSVDSDPGTSTTADFVKENFITDHTPSTPVDRFAIGWADVEPILGQYCTKCHGPRKQKAELALHTEELALMDGEYGAVVLPGDPAGSILIEVMRLPIDAEDHMPPDDKPQPSEDEIAVLEAWIAGLGGEASPGAPAGIPAELPGAPLPAADGPVEQPPSDGSAALEDQDTDVWPLAYEPAALADLVTPEAILADYRARRLASEPTVPGSGFEQAVVLPATIDVQPQLPAPGHLAALAGARVLVEQLGSDPTRLRIDFTGVPGQPGRIAELLAPIAGNVAELNLFGQRPSTADLWVVGVMPRLERLDLRSLDLGAQELDFLSLRDLGGAPVLRELNTAGTPLAAFTEHYLATMERLERVHLWGSTLDQERLAQLREQRPELEILGGAAPPSAPLETEPEVVFRRVDEAADTPGEGELTDTVGDPADATALAPENATCPVSGSPVDPAFTVLYDGRLIGFCCPNCPKSFWDDPASFLAKLDR